MTDNRKEQPSGTEDRETQAKPNWLERVAASRWIGLVGIVVSILALIASGLLSWHYYSVSQKERGLVYAVNPTSTRIVVAGQASELSCLFGGTELGDVDITAVQVAIWNSGKLSIHDEDILKEMRIVTDPPVKILEASVVKSSRDATEFDAIEAAELLAEGVVPVSWHVLEPGDGGSVQLIYIGRDDVEFTIQGVVEGVKEVRCVLSGVNGKTTERQLQEQQTNRTASWIMIALGVACCLFGIYFWVELWERTRGDWRGHLALCLLPAFGVAMIILGTYGLLSTSHSAVPPFGFS